MERILMLACVAFGLGACAATPPLIVTRDAANGTVVLAHEASDPVDPDVGIAHANQIATRHCRLLGYTYTQREVQLSGQCLSAEAQACSRWRVEQSYQCAGGQVTREDRPRVAANIPSATAH